MGAHRCGGHLRTRVLCTTRANISTSSNSGPLGKLLRQVRDKSSLLSTLMCKLITPMNDLTFPREIDARYGGNSVARIQIYLLGSWRRNTQCPTMKDPKKLIEQPRIFHAPTFSTLRYSCFRETEILGIVTVTDNMPGWRNGRRCGLKIRCPKGRAGSTPALGTIPFPNVFTTSST